MSLYTDLIYRRIPQAVGVYVTGAWLGIEVASEVFEAFEFPKSATRLVILLSLAGFPAAMIVGWRYNITARGLERTPEKAGWFARFLIGVLMITVAAAMLVLSRGGWFGAPAAAPASVAVLALRDGTPADPGGVGAAMADEIHLRLAGLPDVRVAATTSSYALAGRGNDIRAVAEELGVRYVVEGSVWAGDGALRVIVSVVDAESGYSLWTASFDGTVDAAAELRAGVATQVARQLMVTAGTTGPDLSARIAPSMPPGDG